MSIQDVKAIQANTNYVLENINSETQEAAQKIETLFSKKFFNGGAESAEAINVEIEILKNYIKQKNQEYCENYTQLKYTNAELNKLNEQLQKEIFAVTEQADKDERLQKAFIIKAIDEVNKMYMDGEIEKSEMPRQLALKIANYNKIDTSILIASNRLNTTRTKIEAITNKLASIMDRANMLETESKLAQGSLALLQNLVGKMSLGRTNNATAANERPIYTPTKQALVDELAAGIKGIGGGSDRNSMANPQMVKMKEFLGLNGDGTQDGKYGVNADSMLLRMKDAGFTAKEAMYAINWIFDGSNMSYNVSNQQWSVPYGHGADAQNTYATLIDQTKKLWGSNANVIGNGGDDEGNPDIGDIPDIEDEDTDEIVDADRRTDPIGYSVGDVTYEFVVDRNGDNKFNDKSEFLGAQNGITELRGLDTDGDGVVTNDEISANENLFVLMTDHKTGEHKFMSAADGNIESIDLSTISSKNWTNINDNQVANVFTVNTVTGADARGYQSFDSAYYIEKSYNGVIGNADMAVKVDQSAMRQAQNIFASIEVLSNYENEANLAEQSLNVKNAQKTVAETERNMAKTADNAENGLEAGRRPETKAEKEERLRKEEEERKAEQEAAEKRAAAAKAKTEEPETEKEEDKK